MNESELREIIAQNIAGYRKAFNLTQLELAEQLNYSDKAVSKWERAEALPDIYVLKQLTELFGITLNDLSTLPKNTEYRRPRRRRSRIVVPLLSAGIVWLAATLCVSGLAILGIEDNYWLIFVAAIPISLIVLLVFSSLWWNAWFSFSFISGLIWSTATLMFFALLPLIGNSVGWVFMVAVPLQFLEFLWAILKWPPKKHKYLPAENSNKPPKG